MKKLLISSLLISALTVASMSNAVAQRNNRSPSQVICTTKAGFVRMITDKTEFICTGGLPDLTFAEILRRGYKIVQISSYSSENSSNYFVEHMLLLEK